MRPLTEGQLSRLRLIARGWITWDVSRSIPSLVKRGLVTDHGRYHASRGHESRYVISAEGQKLVEEHERSVGKLA